MQLADLLRETLDVDCQDIWENKRTLTPVRYFWVRPYSMGCQFGDEWGFRLAGCRTVARGDLRMDHCLADSEEELFPANPTRITVHEATVKIDGEWQ